MDLNQPSEDIDIANVVLENSPTNAKISYKDSLLVVPESILEEDNLSHQDIYEDEPNPKDHCYQDDGEKESENKPFDPCPEIKISKEKLDEWCKPGTQPS
ncbi:hypothetical protein AHAS_Ahas15G0123900 [Arachis hypogaea]